MINEFILQTTQSAFCIVLFDHNWEELLILSWNSIIFLENFILWTVESRRNIENHGPRKILSLAFGLCDEVRSLFSCFNIYIYSDSIGSLLYKFRFLDLIALLETKLFYCSLIISCPDLRLNQFSILVHYDIHQFFSEKNL